MCDKDPVRTKKGWKHKSAQLSFEAAEKNMLHGMNIGIAGTEHDRLVIIDIDDERRIRKKEIKPTLSARSRSRTGTHHFYFADNIDAKINIPTNTSGEIRAYNQYVVAPGSYVPCSIKEIEAMPKDQQQFAGQYTLENATMARGITFLEFPKVFRNRINIETSIDAHKKREQKAHDKRENVTSVHTKSALFDLTITDVVGYEPNADRFPSLFHGSKTGANTSISNNQIHCFRHNVSLTPLRAIAVLAGLDTCMNAGVGHKHSNAGNTTIDLTDGRTLAVIWKYAKDHNMIPQNDPIPTVALVWFSITQGICNENDLEDGWKMPIDKFKETADLLKSVDITE